MSHVWREKKEKREYEPNRFSWGFLWRGGVDIRRPPNGHNQSAHAGNSSFAVDCRVIMNRQNPVTVVVLNELTMVWLCWWLGWWNLFHVHCIPRWHGQNTSPGVIYTLWKLPAANFNPFVIQTQSKSNPRYNGAWHCFRTILREEKFRGLYKARLVSIFDFSTLSRSNRGSHRHCWALPAWTPPYSPSMVSRWSITIRIS